MSVQTWIVGGAALAALAYLLRDFLKTTGENCASGCGSCSSTGCAARKAHPVRVRSR